MPRLGIAFDMAGLSENTIRSLFNQLNEELRTTEISGEIYLLGGAVMCLAFHARIATKDIDAVYAPKAAIRDAVRKIAAKNSLPDDWLNDAAKGFLSEKQDFRKFLELSNLQIFVPQPEYLFAMKSLAMRLGPEFSDEQDVRFLIRALNLNSLNKALEIIQLYYPLNRLQNKTVYALEEIFETMNLTRKD